MSINLTPRMALGLFIAMVVFLLAQAVWWIVFMARLVDEKVALAVELGASPEFVEVIHREEISRQIMVGLEGTFFLVLFFVGVWLIYRSLVKTEELKFHQQNFLMAVTHELKTPLASISVYTDVLKSDKISQEKKLAVIPKIREDVSRLEKLVENVLEAGRFQRSGYTIDREQIDLTKLVGERLDKFISLPLGRPLHINRNLENNIFLNGDRLALGRAIDSILENSLKYADTGSAVVDVNLSGSNQEIVLEISDNGIGIEKKDLVRVFERFYRVGNELTRKSEGTGLGLYLCREIIRAHGGKVTADSPGLGKGARFTIILKRKADYENNSAG